MLYTGYCLLLLNIDKEVNRALDKEIRNIGCNSSKMQQFCKKDSAQRRIKYDLKVAEMPITSLVVAKAYNKSLLCRIAMFFLLD